MEMEMEMIEVPELLLDMPAPAAPTESELVDQYVLICAEERSLTDRKKELQAQLDALGKRALQGSINRVTIVSMPGRKTIDTKAMLADGVFDQDTAQRYTKVSEGFNQYRISV